jgi:transketolase
VALALTRQKLPVLAGTAEKAREGLRRGGYVLRDAGDDGAAADLIFIATGSELQLAFAASERLEADGIRARVVSMPCWETFELQDRAYRDTVLPPDVRKRVSVEIGVSLGWERWVGDEGAIIGLDHFGASAPAGTIFEKFGFTADRVTDIGRRVVRDGLRGRIPTVDGGHFGHMAGHPTLPAGEAGVDRTEDSDPGHS